MIKNKRKIFQQNRLRSQSQDLFDNLDFQEGMLCNKTLELDYFTSNSQQDQQNYDKCTCRCTKCQGYIINIENKDIDAEQKKRQKRRQYKKRQKLKTQQKKQQALRDLSAIIIDIYLLKTDCVQERDRIEQCLKAIQKNENRFYQFINAVIRQQVETIKKQMRICLSQLAAESPNFSKVPRLYEQFMKVKDASPQVEKIINAFIEVISEKNQEPARYHRDLDKKTFRFLLISDVQNRTNFLKVIQLLEQNKIKHQRQKQMLRMMVEIIKQKNISSQCSSSEEDSQDREYSENDEQYGEQDEEYIRTQNTTKSSERQQEEFQDAEYDGAEKQDNTDRKRNIRRRRKNKNLKICEPSFERTYETLLLLEKTLNHRIEEKLPCNLEEDWIAEFKQRFLKKRSEPKAK